MAMTKEEQTNYKRKFNEANYDRIGIYLPKGSKKETWQAAAKERGISLSELIIGAVDEYLLQNPT